MLDLTPHYCVLIPTYNNSGTLLEVIDSVLAYTTDIIIVNDGSTDNTAQLLSNTKAKAVVNFEKNQGKGMALRAGFKKALELGYTHAITIDSDGQHKASDLPAFFNAIKEDPGALYIGSRNMNTENVPGASSFGNKFSSFWFKFETGIDAPDTQSGYRSYPIFKYKNMKFFTSKYEFEIEVIVRSAWKDIPIKFLPIDVYYPPQEERITHFRKIPDFTRISILNTVLVTMALFYYKPRNFIRSLKKKSLKDLFRTYVINSNEPIEKIMLAIFLGSFIGLSPFHGVKTVIIIALSLLFKLNKAVSIGVAYVVGFAPLIPLLIFISHEIGAFILQNNNHLLFAKRQELTVQFVFENLKQQYIGGIVFALTGAIIITLVVFLFYKARKNLKK
ncbi:MAG: DUF2062 domain-containing protein [Chitinophagales bacterium]|nr:DUF2062 domain-containing protein [Chitinophagales bacterium]